MANKKLVAGALALTLGLSLYGCSSDKAKKEAESSSETKTEQSQAKEEKGNEKAKTSGDTFTADRPLNLCSPNVQGKTGMFGEDTFKVVKNGVPSEDQATYTSGPFTITVNGVALGTYTAVEKESQLAYGDKPINAAILEISVENTEDANNTLYVNQTMMVTNTKEQTGSNLAYGFSTSEFYGKVIKEDSLYFNLESKLEDITDLTVTFSAPTNEAFEYIGENTVIKIHFDSDNSITLS